MRSLLPLALVSLASAPSCIAPSVLDSTGRGIQTSEKQLEWRTATSEDFDGFFESTSIEGEAAAAISRIYYHFARGGTYTGAALVIGGSEPEFQTLNGTWRLLDGQLDLGDGAPVRVRAATGHLRLENEGGVVTLARRAIE